MKDWKTTLGGALAAIGTAVSAFSTQVEIQPNYYILAGTILSAVGMVLLGNQAKDKGTK